MTLEFPIVLVQEDSKWWAYVPDLPGVYGTGDSEKEAKSDIVTALEVYIEDLKADGKPLPTSQVYLGEQYPAS